MKIKVEKGQNCIEALEKIIGFLKEECGEYEFLKGDLSLYLSLEDSRGNKCPVNTCEYEYTEGKFENADKVLNLKISRRMLEYAEVELQQIERDINSIDKKIKKAKYHYENAIKKGFKTSEKWKEEFEALTKEKEEENPKTQRRINLLRECLKGKVLLNTYKEVTNWGQNKSTMIYARLVIDPDCNVFAKPVYYCPRDGFTDIDKEYVFWQEFKKN